MKESLFLHELEKKQIDTEGLVEEAIKNKELLHELLDGISSPNPRVKFGSAKILRTISEKCPEMLHSNWAFFVNLLDSKNNILKWNAMDIIANLTTVDSDNKFEGLFKKFYSHLDEGSLITAGHVVDNSGRIALAKPELQHAITKKLLKVESISVPTAECMNILIGKTIDALSVYYGEIKDKREVVSFVKRQLNNPRKSTRTKAERLLKKLETPKRK
jgi:hypothetical protein